MATGALFGNDMDSVAAQHMGAGCMSACCRSRQPAFLCFGASKRLLDAGKSNGSAGLLQIYGYDHNGYIAQWSERLTADQQVPGSNPGVPFADYSARV